MIAALLSALLLGLSVAAPIGPVNLAVIRTGLVRGPRAAWLVGLGAAVVDTGYLLLTYAGVAPLLLRVRWVAPLLALAGSLILVRMAWGALPGRGAPGECAPPAGWQGRVPAPSWTGSA